MDDIITKKEFIDRYKICKRTFENWKRIRGLPVIEISSHRKFLYKNDLTEWEQSIKNK